MVIRANDRISRILQENEELLEVLVNASPQFERLRNPGVRKVMGRLVTVEQAARIAGVDPDDLLTRLNVASGSNSEAVDRAVPPQHQTAVLEPPPSAGSGSPAGRHTTAQMPDPPRASSPAEPARPVQKPQTPQNRSGTDSASERAFDPDRIPAEHVIELDVRDDLRRGEEPFSRIMAAKAGLLPGHVLRLRATFEPVPLYAVMSKQGFEFVTERHTGDDWSVWFRRRNGATIQDHSGPKEAATEPRQAAPAPDPQTDEIVILDVRGLEPPEPMVLTLAALESLPRGSTLLQINVRVPEFLLPRLDELGFDHEVRRQSEDLVRIFIRHRDDR